jgi:site-specific DNA recombinase
VVVLEELRRAGCAVVFLNHAFGQTPEQRMLLQIQGVFAEYERALIHERLRRGRLYAARQGRVTWSQAPYGYAYRPKSEGAPQQLLVHEAEAEVVRQVYRWLVDEQLSSDAIARRLTERGLPTRAGRARHWQQSSVVGLLSNPVYTGEAFYNRTMVADARRPSARHGFKDLQPGNRRGRALRPRAEWIPVRVPALIDPETWELAQAQLARNRERSPRHNTKHDYLLRGLLVCGRCGRRLIGDWGHPTGTGGHYVCPARSPRAAPWHCDGARLATTEVEPRIWAYARDLLSAPDLLKARYDDVQDAPALQGPEAREQERLARRMQALEREGQRLVDAYQAGAIELAELQDRRQRIDDHGRLLRERLGELQQQRADHEQDLRLQQGLDAFCASVRDALAEPSFAVKQQVLRLVVDRIVVDDTTLTVHHVVPTGPVRLQTGQATTGSGVASVQRTGYSCAGVVRSWHLLPRWMGACGPPRVNPLTGVLRSLRSLRPPRR